MPDKPVGSKPIKLTVNGQPVVAEATPSASLLDFLRDGLKLKGAKECCAVGECGACTVIVDGQSVNACLILAAEAEGTHVETIEGQSAGGQLSTVQHSFLKCGAVQCGFCIPGMVMSAEALHRDTPRPMKRKCAKGCRGTCAAVAATTACSMR